MKYSTPEKEGINSRHILEYVKSLEDSHLASHDMIIMRHGKVIFEKYWGPFHKDFLHRQYSQTKSFVSLAIGFLEQDGLVNLDDPIKKYFPKEIQAQKNEYMREQTVRHMLMMSTAKVENYWFSYKPEDRVQYYFENDRKTARPSGTVYNYDSAGSFVLGALVERVTGKQLMDYLREKLFDKIGVCKEAYMLKCPGGYDWGDSALVCKPTDMAKTLQFCLNMGKWNGEQLLNEEYMRAATSKQIDCNTRGYNLFDTQGYGYLIWRSFDDSFFFNGMGVQMALAVPGTDMILVYNADEQGNPDFAKTRVMEGFFNYISRRAQDGEITGNEQAQKELEEYTSKLKLYTAWGEKHKSMQDKINGVTYKMKENDMGMKDVKLVFGEDGCKFCYTNERGYKEIPFGMCENKFAKFPEEGYPYEVATQPGNKLFDCATSAAWVSEFQLYMRVQVIDVYLGVINAVFGFSPDGKKIGINMEKSAEDFLNGYNGFAGGEAID